MVNQDVLLSPMASREAVLSSRIEGTQASLIEVLRHEAGELYDEDKRGEIKEIINYRHALQLAESYLTDRNVSLHLIRELHAVLMKDVRGGDKTPGSFREDQNWIGKKGSSLREARFIPPEPISMRQHLEYLQAFMDSEYTDPLVQLAIVHAQFEVIHPFNDGNGRLGRMLIPLLLFQKKVLQRPSFYLSECLEENDDEYRDRLLAITDKNDWLGWIEFFLKVVGIQAEKNATKAKQIHRLYERMKLEFAKTTKSQYAQFALDALFKHPIINASTFFELIHTPNRSTAYKILNELSAANVIAVLRPASGRTPAIYLFPELLNLAEGRKVF